MGFCLLWDILLIVFRFLNVEAYPVDRRLFFSFFMGVFNAISFPLNTPLFPHDKLLRAVFYFHTVPGIF